jgi:hypothetical protein
VNVWKNYAASTEENVASIEAEKNAALADKPALQKEVKIA